MAAYFTAFGNSSINITFDVVHRGANKLAAVGHEVLVCTSRETLRSQRLPDELRAMLEPFTMSKVEARRSLGVE